VTDATAKEIDRILAATDLPGQTKLFQSAFTLLRIHVDAALAGEEITKTDLRKPTASEIIVLPFGVKRPNIDDTSPAPTEQPQGDTGERPGDPAGGGDNRKG